MQIYHELSCKVYGRNFLQFPRAGSVNSKGVTLANYLFVQENAGKE